MSTFSIKSSTKKYILPFILSLFTLTYLYKSWLTKRVYFYDEWQYLEQIVKADSLFSWIMAPIQQHFSPLGNLVFILGNYFFSYNAHLSSYISVILYALIGVGFLALFNQLKVSFSTKTIFYLLFILNISFYEIFIWCHQKQLLFLLGLVYSFLFAILAIKKKAIKSVNLYTILANLSILISCFSYGQGLINYFLFLSFIFLLYGKKRFTIY